MLLGIVFPLPSYAFNPDYIISDQELDDYNSMNADDIQQFFLDHGSFLAYYDAIWPETGLATRAMDIIWLAAQKFKINPKFILVLLEKEQGLISLRKPSLKRITWAMGYAVCDRCRLNHPLVAKYGGFGSQVYYAADRIRNTYLADLEKYGRTHTGTGPGITKKIDKKYKVTPANNATAALYSYTPHIAGNKNFFLLWNRWFSNLDYPDGSLLQDEATGGVYLIQNGVKRPLASRAVLVSRFDDEKIIRVGRRLLEKYKSGPAIKFPDYSLLRDQNGTVYMTVGDEARPFESNDIFKSLGFSPFEVEDIAVEDISAYAAGKPITLTSAYPTGALLQNKDGGVYWVYDGIKYPVWDKSIIAARFSKYSRIKVDSTELDRFASGDPIKFLDGTLLKGADAATVFMVSGGKLRPIPSEDIFLAYNWEWKNIVTTTDKVLALYEIDAPITLDKQLKSDAAAPIILEEKNQNEQEALLYLN